MNSRSRKTQSFYGSPSVDERRIEERYNQVRQRRLSAFHEVEPKIPPERDSDCKQNLDHWTFHSFRRRRSRSLPDPTRLHNMAIRLENEMGAIKESLSRPRSASFDPTAKLYTAVAENDTAELESVLESGKADPNRLYLSGIAPLHIAAAEGHLECIKILVYYGANINVLDAEGCSPLEFALRGAHFDCAALLIKVGAETKKIVHGFH